MTRLEVGNEQVRYYCRGSEVRCEGNRLEVGSEPVRYHSRGSGVRCEVNRLETTTVTTRLKGWVGSEPFRGRK